MKNKTDVLWGVVIIAVAILIALHFLNVWTLHFFDGWWTLFIIIPSLIALTKKEDRAGGAFGLIIGVLLLLSANDVMDFSIIWKVIIVVILVAIGLKLIFNGEKRTKCSEDSKVATAVFSEENICYNKNQEFKDCDCKAIFGSVDLDLRNAKVISDGKINALSLFGGINIIAPSDVNLEVNSTGIFGGVKNHVSNDADNEFTIHVNATAIFGGVDIK